MLRRIHEWAKAFIYLDVLFHLAWYVVAGVVSLLFVVVVVIRGDYDRVPELMLTALGAAAFLGFATWVARDSRKAARIALQLRREARRRRRDTGTNVAGPPD
jgi:hypothetical protein